MVSNEVELEGIVFEKIIDAEEIKQIVSKTAENIKKDYEDKEVIFLVVLNGAFVFAADLLREYDYPCFTYFIKVSSYDGMQSTNEVKIVGLPEDVKGKHLVLIEDIVDTGLSMQKLLEVLKEKEVASVEICTLFFKPENFKGNYSVKYIGKEIQHDFIVGYGLDLNNKGRNLSCVYQRKK